MEDNQILEGLLMNQAQRVLVEKALYLKYRYFIDEGRRKFQLNQDDSFSAYSDAVLSAIVNISNRNFKNDCSLKTYLYRIFSNKCIDLIRKITTNKEKMHHDAHETDLLGNMPDQAKSVIEKLIERQKLTVIKEFLEVIGQKCKQLLLLYEDGYTDNQIAEILTYNTAAVAKTTRMRCLEKIKDKMKSIVKNHE